MHISLVNFEQDGRILESYLPQWFIDLASISSFVGLPVTVFLFFEARKIKKSFLLRARLPEIINDLSKITSDISKNLREREGKKQQLLLAENFSKARGLLVSLDSKLSGEEQKSARIFLKKLQRKNFRLFGSKICWGDISQVWEFYEELNTLVTRLDQTAKDSNWE